MGWKILTSATEMVRRYGVVQAITTVQVLAQQTATEIATETATQLAQKPVYRFVNVQRLLAMHRAVEIFKMSTFIEPPEMLQRMSQAYLLPFEEREYVMKGLMTEYELEEERLQRYERIKPEERLQQILKRRLHQNAINLIDHTSLCLYEKFLWETQQATVTQILKQLIDMCVKRTYFIEPITGSEALQKSMLQTYIFSFMEYPMQLNMQGLKITALTMMELKGMRGTFYAHLTIPAQAIKPKLIAFTDMARKNIVKWLSSGKTPREYIPTKWDAGISESIDEDDKVSLGKDKKGHDIFFTMLRYAYSMPYWLRRFYARQLGMPENHKYARYFGIGCIPTRRSLLRWKKERMPEYIRYLHYSSDPEIMNMIRKYQSRYGTGRPYSGRYKKRYRD